MPGLSLLPLACADANPPAFTDSTSAWKRKQTVRAGLDVTRNAEDCLCAYGLVIPELSKGDAERTLLL